MGKVKRNNIEEYHLHQHQPDQAQFVIHDLKSYLHNNKPDTTIPHIHSYHQVIWFLSGTGRHFVDFVSHEVRDEMIFFIAKNQVHCFDLHTNYEGYLLHFNESFLVQDLHSDATFKYHLFNTPHQLPYCKPAPGCTVQLQVIIDQIKQEQAENTLFGKDELLRSYLKSFLILALRSKVTLDHQQAGSLIIDEKRLQLIKFFNLVAKHYKEGLTVTDYARLMHISSRSLSDLTNQQVNKTPLQMIQEHTILEAQRLLVHSNLNINQIAYLTGFDDPSYFVKFFKKHTKTSPSDFRKTVS